METPPKIQPLPEASGVTRPKWSVMVPVFNGGQFLRQTLESVLTQAFDEDQMQIEVVDDCSTDIDVQALVKEVAGERVGYFRQEANVGSLQNFATCLNRARGYFVHLLHADDLVLPGYYNRMAELFSQNPSAGAAFCGFGYVNEFGEYAGVHPTIRENPGILDDALATLASKQEIQYCAITVKREVYEQLGGFYGVTYGEDWEMWVRMAARYPVLYTPERLARYRIHQHSISGNSIRTGKNMRDLEWVMNQNKRHLPVDRQAAITGEARKFYAEYAVRTANRLWHANRDAKAAFNQVKEAFRMNPSPYVFWKTIKLIAKIILRK